MRIALTLAAVLALAAGTPAHARTPHTTTPAAAGAAAGVAAGYLA